MRVEADPTGIQLIPENTMEEQWIRDRFSFVQVHGSDHGYAFVTDMHEYDSYSRKQKRIGYKIIPVKKDERLKKIMDLIGSPLTVEEMIKIKDYDEAKREAEHYKGLYENRDKELDELEKKIGELCKGYCQND